LQNLQEEFLQERRLLENVTASTVEWYQTAFGAFTRSPVTVTTPKDLNKAVLQTFVVLLRARGVKPVSINSWLRACGMRFARGCTPTGI
jgi:hypothetical protein